MATLQQLADLPAYRACDWDLAQDSAGRDAWVRTFIEHADELLAQTRESYPEAPPERLAAFRRAFVAAMESVAATPQRYPRIDILLLDELREGMQREYGFPDPFAAVKARVNRAALADLPVLLAELDAVASPAAEVELLARGLMAGNLFDLGARVTADQFRQNGHQFWAARDALGPRPWFIDHVERWQARWATGRPYRHAVLFVDNAGGDVCLGCLPLARWMNRHGTRVTLAANSRPALNDITAAELIELLAVAAGFDDAVARAVSEELLVVVATGTGAPLLDLTALSPECVAAAADADLLVLQGMGRALESNFDARFRCAVLRTAVVKDELLARRLGARLMDCVFRFDR